MHPQLLPTVTQVPLSFFAKPITFAIVRRLLLACGAAASAWSPNLRQFSPGKLLTIAY
jgi:hypothetical protein